MDKNYLIDEYLKGKHPIEQEKWDLPTESELDRDEALFDALLAERGKRAPLLRGRGWGWVSIAAAIVIAIALFTWRSFVPQQPTQLAEKTEEPVKLEDAPRDTAKRGTPNCPTRHVMMAHEARLIDQRGEPSLKTQQQTVLAEAQPAAETPVLANAADSLYYYLTQLENQMGDCRDSTCLAELTGLMRADERIKNLVNKILHRQVETAYKEEYLVDTTTRYIPL